MTPDDIREREFVKAVFGGYDMAQVDDFVEECAEAMEIYGDQIAEQIETKYQGEIANMRSKMKVLVDTVNEYRGTEEAMRLALLSAQKMGVEIESSAKERAEALESSARSSSERATAEATEFSERVVAEARDAAESIINRAKSEVVLEEMRLVEAKKRSAEFLENMRALVERQLEFFDNLSNMKIEDLTVQSQPAPVPVVENTIRYSGAASAVEEPAAQPADGVRVYEIESDPEEEDVQDEEPEPEPEPEAPESQEPTRRFNVSELSPEERTPRPKFNFDDLKFGDNYEEEED